MFGKDRLGWTSDDYAAQHAVAQHQGIPDDWLAAVEMSESSMNPAARNPSGAQGLIQFANLGQDITGWTPAQQMPLIDAYFTPKRPPGGWISRAQLYQAGYLPITIKTKGSEPNTILSVQGDGFYQGAIFDRQGKGFTTVADLEARLNDVTYGASTPGAIARWNAALAGIAAAGGSFGIPASDSLTLAARVFLIAGVGIGSFLLVEELVHRMPRTAPRYARTRRRMAA